MARKGWLLQRSRGSSVDGVTAAVVWAEDAAQARDVAEGAQSKDPRNSWSNATATEIKAGAGLDWEGWTFEINVASPAGAIVAAVSYLGTSANDTLDEIAAQLVILLNADDSIAGAAYNSTTQVLTIAETTDNLGDHRVVAYARNPNGAAISGIISSVVDEGAVDAALSLTLPADAVEVPYVVALAGE